MDHLLNPKNLPILESFSLVNTLFAFDYDGTLAPISAHPQEATMSASTAELLKKLSGYFPVAIITGRAIADVEKFLPVRPTHLIGNHGAEGEHHRDDLGKMNGLVRFWLTQLRDVRPIMEKLGITVEDKTYSLSFHYRNAPDPAVAEGALELMLAPLASCRLMKGKCVMNALPIFSMDKGKALQRIMVENHYEFAVYFGDDQTDEDVFGYRSPKFLTVKIGAGPTEAKFFLQSQTEIDKVLELVTNMVSKVRV